MSAQSKQTKKQTAWHFFSETLPEDLQETVQAISANGVSQFATDLLAYDSSQIQFKAWVNKHGLWTVDKYVTTAADTDEAMTSKQTVIRNTCFFDALHYVARSEKVEKDMGAASVGGPDNNVPHFRAAAEGAGQPLDMAGIPHPAADGQILTDGNFNKKNYDIAAKTADIVPGSSQSPANLKEDFFKEQSLVPLAANENQVYRRVTRHYQIFLDLEGAYKAGDDIFKALRHDALFHKIGARKAINEIHELNDNPFGLFQMGVTLTAGLSALVYYPTMTAIHKGAFKKATRAMEKAANRMENEGLKKLALDFNKAATFTLHAERAAVMVDKYVEKRKPPEKLKKSFKHIEAAAKVLDLSEPETQKLKADFLQHAYPEGHFLEQLLRKWSDGENSVSRQIKQEIRRFQGDWSPPQVYMMRD